MTRYRRPATMSAAMMSTGTAASGSAPAGRAPAGPALTALRGAAVWAVSFIRAVVVACIAVQVVIWPSVYSADARRLAGPLAAVALDDAVVAYRRMLERGADGTDGAVGQADRDAREQRVVLSRSTERREHERLLHDTVLNTRTALARPGRGCPGRSSPGRGDRDEVVGRCRRDIALMEYALSDPAGPAQAAGRPYGGLLIGIEAAAIEMRARGLDGHGQVAGAVEKARGA